MEAEENLEKRESKIYNWLSDKYNLGLVVVLVFAFLVRLYYFTITKDQALWWDELIYGTLAKNILSGFAYSQMPILVGEIMIRPPIVPFIWAVLMKIGFEEPASKFVLEFLPSFFSILMVYLIGEKMYNKKIALIASAVLAVSWLHIFYSMRMLTDVPAPFFALLSIYFFFKAGEELKLKPFALSIFFLSIAILIRYPVGLIGFVYIAFLLFTQKLSFLKKKTFWIGGIIGMIPIVILFAYNFITSGSLFPAALNYAQSAGEKTSFAYYTLGFLPHILQWPFLILFIAGILIVLLRLFVGYDLINKNKMLKSDLFLSLLLIFTLAFFIFLIKAAEDRYLFIAVLSLVVFPAIAIEKIASFLQKNYKISAILVVSVLLLAGAYYNYTYGDAIIKDKAQSYYDIKQVSLWMNTNLPNGSRIIGETSSPYIIYYAPNLIPVDYPPTSIPSGYVPEADYLFWSAYNWHNDYIKNYLPKIQNDLNPVYATFFDTQKTQTSVIIYQFKK
ncbi:MAG: glycosyltransferase family 39 protein [Nanoarchaeota archaeon]|nr:glycosyltransferase family 39 protein [Nanoarchaeota archaeon]